jgi:hypothetical protein
MLPVELGKTPALRISLYTGRNHVKKATIKVSAPSTRFQCEKATMEVGTSSQASVNLHLQDGGTEERALDATEEEIAMSDLPSDKYFDILVPHTDSSQFHSMVSY